ncbi:ABC transporter permease [Acetivibrio mesophilus]|uniref:ABC transporter permease n=1 Tax=Acetivibrio mesophilus TaxID=2487273 RepID=A0A4Q0I261_9FIRM|nr:ABC transporter permease [Acetivibrio mesophilus]RXE58283.1 ABC transporter permease [Acetivibrio mesophilus]
MNASKHVWIVFKKEVKDIVRDKKTLLTSIFVPMLLIPILSMLVGGSIEDLSRDINENVTIALTQESNTDEIRDIVENQIIKDYPNISLIDTDDPIKAINESKVRVVLDFEKDYASKLAEGKPFAIKLIYDKSQTKSQGSLGILWNAIGDYNDRIVKQRLDSLGVNPEILTPAMIEESNIANEEKTSGSILAVSLPMMLVVLMASGGIAAATDLVAGEKERNTFEPLLTTKPGRSSLLLGKYLAVTLFSFVSVVATMIGAIIGFVIDPSSMGMGVGTDITGFSIQPLAFFMVIVISITLGMTFSGLQIALSSYAKSFKEAQTYMSFLMIIVMIPAFATMLMQPNDIPVYMFLVPVMNTLSAFKIVLGGSINYAYLLMALGSSVVYVVITLCLAATLFKKENVILRS